MLDPILKKEIKNHALSDIKNEVCGFIIQSKERKKAIRCTNISDNPKNHFLISPEEKSKVEKQGKIIGIYHSHVDGIEFSDADVAIAEFFKINSFIYCPALDVFNVYIPQGYEIPYINRPFLLGVLDCIELFRDYYKREFNILLPPLNHESRIIYDWSKDSRLNKYNKKENQDFKQYLVDNNFQEVSRPEKDGDIVLMVLPKMIFVCHSAIYLGNNSILHHYPDRLSGVESYSNVYKKLTKHIMRHKYFNT